MKRKTYSLDIDNMHHAYLLVGNVEKVLKELKENLKRDLKIDIDKSDSDFLLYKKEVWTIEDSRNFKTESIYRPIKNQRRIIIICTESIILEAEQALLKVFEEPVDNVSIFFIIQNDSNLLDTFVSRFARLETACEKDDFLPWAKDFINASFSKRQKIVTEILKKHEEGLVKKEEIENYITALGQLIKKEKNKLWEDKLEYIYKSLSWTRSRSPSLKIILESLVAIV